ncbi:PREDICTED: probable membrane-associated kinase regulator 2 [Ipomoea nil]|uniref:probable membrane-associated kinase regulator 2 n=1 Tax=Ipomoea nil TaxID=35883 RepID=UPI000900D7DA|nr:PREDICTED: probable membrane-associated kinase regulator 2 [Ipomoea nil]
MEAFNLLKFWRSNGGGGDGVSDDADSMNNSARNNNDGRNPALETDEESDEESFFDLVLNGADYSCRDEKPKAVEAMRKGETSLSFPESPKDVFLKGNAFSVDSCSKPQSPISLLRTAPKFRVFFLGFKKSKVEKSLENDGGSGSSPKHQQLQKAAQNEQSKRFAAVNCKVDDVEVVVGSSLPSRENSLRSKLQMEKFDDLSLDEPSKRFAKNAVPKYLKLIKPLYSKASKCTEKSNLSDKLSVTSPLSPATTETLPMARRLSEERQGSRTAGFSIVRKHLVKSRSASAGTASPPARRRDESLLEQQDGIQSAILHCKSSYNSTTRGSSLLSRSVSEPHPQKSTDPQRSSYEDTKRCSI